VSDLPPAAGSPAPAPAPRKHRGLFAALAVLALLALGVWFVAFFWPCDPAALPRAVPAGTRFVLRAQDLPAAVDECLLNPLFRVVLAAAGVSGRDVAALSNDPETRKWLEKLSGEECLFGLYEDGLFGASFLGAGATRLRWQLQLFRLDGMTKLANGGWRYDGDDLDLPPGCKLHFALEDGCLFAWIGENASGLDACLAAARGQAARLWDGESSFVSFLTAPADAGTLRAWTAPVPQLDVPVLLELAVSPDALAATAAAPAANPFADLSATPADPPPASFGNDAVLALSADGTAFPWAAGRFGNDLLPWARHVCALAGDFAEGPVYAFLLTGAHGGRLAFGALRIFGRGLKVPALLLATKASDPAAVQAKIDRALADCNRRYRGRFVFREDADGIRRLASEDADEWTEMLSETDRPAYALRDGWLWVSSSAAVLRTVLAERAAGGAAEDAWRKAFRDSRAALSGWADLVAFDGALRDWIGLFQTAKGFMGSVQGEEERRALRNLRTWAEELRAFGSLSLAFGGDGAGRTWASLALGDAAAPAAERLLSAVPAGGFRGGAAGNAAAAPAAEEADIPPVEPIQIAPPVGMP
jgi:hypothetical protein